MWTHIKKEEQSKMEKVFELDKDLPTALKQTMLDLREEADQSIYSEWGISPKEIKWCDIKVMGAGDDGIKMEFHVNELVGMYRGLVPPAELDKRMLETESLLRKFEKAFRKHFKELTGKNLRLSNARTFINRERVALNDLYRFFAIKTVDVKTDLGRQTFNSNYKDQKSKELK